MRSDCYIVWTEMHNLAEWNEKVNEWMLSVCIGQQSEIKLYVNSRFECYFWYFDKLLLVLYTVWIEFIFVFYNDGYLCFPPLFSHNHIKNAEGCGHFQDGTQFSHCFGLKWVSVTKAACIWAELNHGLSVAKSRVPISN